MGETRDWRDIKRQRTRQINIRVSDEELEKIEADAGRAGITVGAYVRQVLLDAPIPRQSKRPSIEKESLSKLLGQIGKIGSNINQLAKSNNRGIAPYAHEMHTALEMLLLLQQEVLQALGKRADIPQSHDHQMLTDPRESKTRRASHEQSGK